MIRNIQSRSGANLSLQIFGVERRVYLLVDFTTYVVYRHGLVHGKHIVRRKTTGAASRTRHRTTTQQRHPNPRPKGVEGRQTRAKSCNMTVACEQKTRVRSGEKFTICCPIINNEVTGRAEKEAGKKSKDKRKARSMSVA